MSPVMWAWLAGATFGVMASGLVWMATYYAESVGRKAYWRAERDAIMREPGQIIDLSGEQLLVLPANYFDNERPIREEEQDA